MTTTADPISTLRTQVSRPISVPASLTVANSAERSGSASLAEIVSGLSFALDLTEDSHPGHAVRSCLLGMRIATEARVPHDQLSGLYYALLLKDIGCSANANLLREMVGGDDPAIKRRIKLADWRYPVVSSLGLLWETAEAGGPRSRNSGSGQLWAGKSRRALRLLWRGASFRRELARLRCQSGANIARRIGLPAASVAAIGSLDERWDGGGSPDRLRGAAIPVLARVINLAQCLDLFASQSGTAAALQRIHERRGRWFDPALASAARSLARRNCLWTHYGSGMERKLVLEMEPGAPVRANDRQIDRIAAAFAEAVDAKSSFTCGHALGVREAATHIARGLGVSGERVRLISRAALLHDLGKLRVPNTILDKPGRLDVIEWQAVREHPGLSGEILGRIKPLKHLARPAAEHHERLDGSGYPAGLKADQLSIESRILAVADVYGALLEDRSYRQGLSRDEAMATVSRCAPDKLDADCCAALLDSPVSALPLRGQDFRLAALLP